MSETPPKSPSPGPRVPICAVRCPPCAAPRRQARVLSLLTGTPFYVMRNGQIVDLNSGDLWSGEQLPSKSDD